MAPDIPRVAGEVPSIDQVASVLEDLEDGTARFEAVLGISSRGIYLSEPPRLTETTHRGESHDYSMASP